MLPTERMTRKMPERSMVVLLRMWKIRYSVMPRAYAPKKRIWKSSAIHLRYLSLIVARFW